MTRYSTLQKQNLDTLGYQQIVMPFLEPVVYPTQRNKDDIEHTIYIGNVLGSWQEKQSAKKLRIYTQKKKIPKQSTCINYSFQLTYLPLKGSKNPQNRGR